MIFFKEQVHMYRIGRPNTYTIVFEAVLENQFHICEKFLYLVIVSKMTTSQFALDGPEVHWLSYNLVVVWNLRMIKRFI